jgi:ribonuclease BN (tRNA processing enzyme)
MTHRRTGPDDEISVIFLGTRGAVPVDGPAFSAYGGATSCVLARMGGENILLDAGSGLLRAAPLLPAEGGRVSLLLSHPHVDHMIGLPAFAPLYNPAFQIDLYAANRGGLSAREQVERLMSFPLWPIGPEVFSVETGFFDVRPRFSIGAVEVETTEGSHPGGATVYRLSHGGRSLVYCTDFEHGDDASRRLADLAAGCDLLIYDAQFSDAEYEGKRGWGHSTWDEGIRAARRCGARLLALFHHDPARTDDALRDIEARLKNDFPGLFFSKCGEVISL